MQTWGRGDKFLGVTDGVSEKKNGLVFTRYTMEYKSSPDNPSVIFFPLLSFLFFLQKKGWAFEFFWCIL
jgi:hypothetical protein